MLHRQNTALWPAARERALARMSSRRRRGISIQLASSRRDGPQLPDVHEDTIRFWWQPPDRLREEVSSNVEHRRRSVVLDGDLWWLWGMRMGAVTNELLDEPDRANHSAGGGERFLPLLDPSWLLATAEIDDVRAGDGVLHVAARVRDDLDESVNIHRVPLTGGADRFDLEVDAGLGVLRAVTAWLDGAELEVTRLEELALGEAFAAGIFERPPGIDFSPPGGDVREVTLEDAAEQAPFPVFYLPQLPDGLWRLRVNRLRRPAFALWLVYHRADGRESFSLGQSAETADVDDEHTVVLERDGTHLVLRSDTLPRETLVELAARLERFTPS